MVAITGDICERGADECAGRAGQYRCCVRDACLAAARFAREKYGITLQSTGNPDLPFMGSAGCIVPAHLRPLCALHVCQYSWSKGAHRAPDGYEKLRDAILDEAKLQNREPL